MLKSENPDIPTGNNSKADRGLNPDPDELLRPDETAAVLKFSVRTLEAMRLRGGGPLYIALSRRAVRYRRSDIDAWIASRERRSTSDPGPTPAEGECDVPR